MTETLKRIVTGRFDRNEVKRYLAFQTLAFWGAIFVAWLSYPTVNQYSIMTHTFSFLGSFEKKHNPEHWWIFSLAMVFWGMSSIPVVLYLYRRFAMLSTWGARVGCALMLLGSISIVFVGLFPEAHGEVIGEWEWTDIHMKAAPLVAVGYIFAIPLYGILLLRDRFSGYSARTGRPFNHRKLLYPYLFWGCIMSAAIYYQVKWEFVYADMKAAAQAAGQDIGSHWSAALNTRYSFPLWENVVIYTLFAFTVWLTLAVPGEAPQDGQTCNDSARFKRN